MKDNLYIVKVYNGDGDSIIKLGYSNNIENRLRQYYYHNPLIELIGTYYMENAIEVEKNIHNTLKSVCLNEWYNEDKLDYILSIVGEVSYNSFDLGSFSLKDKSQIKDKKYYDALLDTLKVDSLALLYRLIRKVNDKHIVEGYNDNMSNSKLGEYLNMDRRRIALIISELKNLKLLGVYKGFWVINPNVYRKNDSVPVEIWNIFE